MPNHVTTVCTLTGDSAALSQFEETHIIEYRFDLDTIVPMPESIKNTIRPAGVAGDGDIELYARALIEDANLIIMPTPPWLSTEVLRWGELLRYYDEKNPIVKLWAQRRLFAAAETGYPSWYEWSVVKWGTKWNAYKFKVRSRSSHSFVFEFDTAWDVPRPIFEALTKRYPQLMFRLRSVNEGGQQLEGEYLGGEGEWREADPTSDRYRFVYGHDEEAP